MLISSKTNSLLKINQFPYKAEKMLLFKSVYVLVKVKSERQLKCQLALLLSIIFLFKNNVPYFVLHVYVLFFMKRLKACLP